VLGVDRNTISTLTTDKKLFHSTGKGAAVRYELAQCIQAYIVYRSNIERSKAEKKHGSVDREEAELRKINAEVRIKEIAAEKEEAKVITIEESNDVLDKVFTAVRTQLIQIPGSWTPLLLAKTDRGEVSNILVKQVDKLLNATLNNVQAVLDEELLEKEEDGNNATTDDAS